MGVSECLDSIQQLDEGQTQDHFIHYSDLVKRKNNAVLLDFKGKIGTEETVISGHSMGGATTVRILNTDNRFSGGVALDSWMFPLKNEKIGFNKDKLLFVNFERFQNDKNLTTMQRFETKPSIDGVSSNVVSLKNSAHYSCTDILIIFQSTFLGSLVLGKQDEQFDAFGRLLTSSELFSGWVKHNLRNESSEFLSAFKSSRENTFQGIRFKQSAQ